MTIAWKDSGIPAASRPGIEALNALLEAGYHNPRDKGPAAVVKLELHGNLSAKRVLEEITKTQRSTNPLAQAIVDQRLGAAKPSDEDSRVLNLYTTEPTRAKTALQHVPQVRVAAVNAL